MTAVVCPICQWGSSNNTETSDGKRTCYNCERCGQYSIDRGDIIDIATNLRPALSKFARTLSNRPPTKAPIPEVTEEMIAGLRPITPFEKAENLLLYLGERQNYSGEYVCIDEQKKRQEVFALVGVEVQNSEANFNYIFNHLIEDKLIDSPDINAKKGKIERLHLTFKGWEKYTELQRTITDSKVAFMAMKFPGEVQEPYPAYEKLEVAYNAFQNAVSKTGFTLTNPLLERPEGGSIDNRLAVEIRKAKFVIADLSHDNQGVYWEAGFAQGLDKKVFYTCVKDDRIKPHFDINHHTTIFWEAGREQEAAQRLKDVIRNTFPEDAILED